MGLRRMATAVLVGSAAIWTAPSTANAQLPACDAAKTPVAYFSGLPDQLITGRDHVFRVLDRDDGSGFVNGDVHVVMSENGVPYWSGTIGEFDLENQRLFIRSDPGDSPLTVTASYPEYRMDTVYPEPAECQRVLAKTMSATAGRAQRPLWVRGHFDEGQFILRTRRSCRTSYAPDPVAVSVRARGRRRWARVGTADQCEGWAGRASGRHFRLHQLGGDPQTLLFVPRTPRRNGSEDFQFRITRATVSESGHVSTGRTLRRGAFRVITHHWPRERVYAYNPDGSVNDRYWNYCVNGGKTVWMHNGNPYCIDPALTVRRVKLLR